MSPELLDPPRFGSDGRPTPESDCYALGMVIYEVSSLDSSSVSPVYLAAGSNWLPTIPSHVRLYPCARYNERRASGEALRRGISGLFRYTLVADTVVLE